MRAGEADRLGEADRVLGPTRVDVLRGVAYVFEREESMSMDLYLGSARFCCASRSDRRSGVFCQSIGDGLYDCDGDGRDCDGDGRDGDGDGRDCDGDGRDGEGRDCEGEGDGRDERLATCALPDS